MNIETLQDYVRNYNQQVIESGLRRDVIDYADSLEENEHNIIGLKEIAKNVFAHLEKVHQSDLPSNLKKLIPNEEPTPFTKKRYDEKLSTLLSNKEIQQDDFYSTLETILSSLREDLESNSTEVDRIAEFIAPYVSEDEGELQKSDKAILSIIFKDQKTVGELDEFSKSIAIWNKILPLYHQLVTHTSPEKIEIVEVQNGSIDLVLNLNASVALHLGSLFKVGFLAYGTYLFHRKLLLPMTGGYFGNKKLLELDEEKERVLLNNIFDAVAKEAKLQEQEAKSKGSRVDNPDKVIERVATLVTAHIVRGNDVKILALPKSEGDDGKAKGASELREASIKAHNALKELPPNEVTLLLKQYGEQTLPEVEEKPGGKKKNFKRKNVKRVKAGGAKKKADQKERGGEG